MKNSQTLELRLPESYTLILEEMKVRVYITEEKYEEYRNLAEHGKINDIPHTIFTGISTLPDKSASIKGIRLRNYFIDKYSAVNN